ncbi:unnamed protein product [Orchesella dallaii]|uniref:Uncharacterized protein n=2 Tax=Orchesella dallaii TaxID=48710 RepID=A0ABP1RTS1_9HEXA
MNSARHVYTPGSVDSWDMENLKFLRKMSHGGGTAGGRDLDQDTLSYVSDSEQSTGYDDQASCLSEDEKDVYGGRKNHDEESDYGTSSLGSEIQSPTRLLDEALYSGGNGFALLNKTIVMKQMKSMAASTLKDPYLEEEVESQPILPAIMRKTTAPSGGASGRKPSRLEESNFDRRFMKQRKPKPSLLTLGFMEPQLEDCYLLDVMTIRNESVLAERGRRNSVHCVHSDSQDSESEGMEKVLKLNGRRNGSAGLPSSSSSSVSSSSEEFNSAREGSYYPSHGEDDPIEIHRDSSPEGTRASSCSPVSVVVRGECTTRYPVCGYTQSSERSFETASSNYYYLGQQQEDFEPFEDSAEQSDEKDEMRMLETPRSASPYYVRLRRDLLPPSYTPPHPRQPWNFGMNRNGLLVIDYSPNWDGLETYVRSLSMQN